MGNCQIIFPRHWLAWHMRMWQNHCPKSLHILYYVVVHVLSFPLDRLLSSVGSVWGNSSLWLWEILVYENYTTCVFWIYETANLQIIYWMHAKVGHKCFIFTSLIAQPKMVRIWEILVNENYTTNVYWMCKSFTTSMQKWGTNALSQSNWWECRILFLLTHEE